MGVVASRSVAVPSGQFDSVRPLLCGLVWCFTGGECALGVHHKPPSAKSDLGSVQGWQHLLSSPPPPPFRREIFSQPSLRVPVWV